MAVLSTQSTVLVTGASGFLGGHVVNQLMAHGVGVIGVGRNRAKLAALGCRTLCHDIAVPFDPASVPQIDGIVHCAALSAPFGPLDHFVRANVSGTQNVIDLAKVKDVARIVHISTPSVYFSYRDQLDVAETYLLPRPVNAYAQTKAQGEELVMDQLGKRAIVLRPRGIYGPGDTALLPRLLRAARQRPLPLLRNGQAEIDLTYVDDVVQAIMAALGAPDTACGEVFNVSGGEVLSIRHIVDATCARAGVSTRWRALPLGPAMLAAGALEKIAARRHGYPEPAVTRYGLGLFAYRQSLDLRKASDVLGWTPNVPFARGLAQTFDSAL